MGDSSSKCANTRCNQIYPVRDDFVVLGVVHCLDSVVYIGISLYKYSVTS